MEKFSVDRSDAWLTESKPITSIFKGVIVNNKEPRDRPINDIIQETGCHLSGSDPSGGCTVINMGELLWAIKNRGYSKKHTGGV